MASRYGEPFSPTKIHPLLSPHRPFGPTSGGLTSNGLPLQLPPLPPSPLPLLAIAPEDDHAHGHETSSVAAADPRGGAPALQAHSSIAPSHEKPRTDPPAPISTASSIENLTTLPQKSFREHRSRKHQRNACSIDSIPRQTIAKALRSRPPTTSPAASMDALVMNGARSNPSTHSAEVMPHHKLAEALAELDMQSDDVLASRVAALSSPCFFHKKFDKAVNLEKVLDEMAEDETISHSRLMQTATSVREVSKQLQRRPIRMTVRNVMIVTKARDNELVHLTRELAHWLLCTPRYGSDVGVNVYVDHKLRKSKRFDMASLLARDPRFADMLRFWTPELCWESPEKFDLVLTLGGDGTVLFTSWLFQRIVPPILSFSLGSLGFLTNFEFPQYQPALSKIMGDAGMRVNLRMRFTCTVYRFQKHAAASPDAPSHIEAEQFEVLNELVIDRGPSPYVSNLELYGDNNLLTVVQADGCIFSTPTGSTAYSLSAGGSLVHPDIPAILLTPICPHTLSFRPMLLNDSMLLRIAVPRNSRATAYCAFDGKGRVELRQGDHVTIAASQYPFPTVLERPTEWFDSISRTLRWNTRGAMQKGWAGDGVGHGEREAEESAEDQAFDIDFDDVDAEGDADRDRDSGYSNDGGSVSGSGHGDYHRGRESPVRKGIVMPFL